MDYTRLRALGTLFSMVNQAIRNVITYNSNHSDFPMQVGFTRWPRWSPWVLVEMYLSNSRWSNSSKEAWPAFHLTKKWPTLYLLYSKTSWSVTFPKHWSMHCCGVWLEMGSSRCARSWVTSSAGSQPSHCHLAPLLPSLTMRYIDLAL